MILDANMVPATRETLVKGDLLYAHGNFYGVGSFTIDDCGTDMVELHRFPLRSERTACGTIMLPLDQILMIISAGDAHVVRAEIGMQRAEGTAPAGGDVASLTHGETTSPYAPCAKPRIERLLVRIRRSLPASTRSVVP